MKQRLKVDLRKVDFDKDATHNIWLQLGIDINKTKKKYNVQDYYIPHEEQNKLIDYMIKNNTKCKAYSEYIRRSKVFLRKAIAWEYLAWFPRGVKHHIVDADKKNIPNAGEKV